MTDPGPPRRPATAESRPAATESRPAGGRIAGPARRFALMPARDPSEPHRASTPLELLFDLVFVVAVAQAASSLHHAIIEGHALTGLLSFVAVYFAIWWAWMNWTWFASAFDNDDVIFRLVTFVQMFGALILAAGVSDAFSGDYRLVVVGYAVMRFAMVAQWLRAAASNPMTRATALRFAGGVTVVQLLWMPRAAIPGVWAWVAFAALCAAELAVPWWAERGRPTPWHPGHIGERHMLFAMIMLGEAVLASTVAVRSGMAAGTPGVDLIVVSACGFVIVCVMWWLYNSRPAHGFLRGAARAFGWGYGHFFVFSSIAAFGAGLAAVVDVKDGAAGHFDALAVRGALTVPVAAFLVSVWAVHIRPHRPAGAVSASYLAGAALVALATFTPVPLELTALVMIATLAGAELGARRDPPPPPGRPASPREGGEDGEDEAGVAGDAREVQRE
ncbi:low temperature requirement protein A [Sphaerisporangium corydalis]|uniref:Low temperature requirement protein A n=1 Tax=Sphaerisporangium corydalis TaxID=1441875 RepID=A0ABV9E967_9ACTN|nr:low temperature requirement protein A [Sphaerisporangium corydalis]